MKKRTAVKMHFTFGIEAIRQFLMFYISVQQSTTDSVFQRQKHDVEVNESKSLTLKHLISAEQDKSNSHMRKHSDAIIINECTKLLSIMSTCYEVTTRTSPIRRHRHTYAHKLNTNASGLNISKN